MRGILLAVGLVLLAVLAAFLFYEPAPDVRPERPDSETPEAGDEPEAMSPPLNGLQTPTPPIAPEPDVAARTVRVTTNVGGASVTLRLLLCGGVPDPAPMLRTADAAGEAEFPVPETQEPIHEMVAEARAPGYRPATKRVRDDEAKIELIPGVPITGRTVDIAGEPIVGTTVSAGPDAYCRTDSAGSFEVYLPEAGPVKLSVTHHAHRNTTLEASAPGKNLEVVLERGLTVSGRVSFPDGKPVPGSGLQTWKPHALATTGDDGRYVLAGYATGVVKVQCSATGEKREVETGANDVDFVTGSHVVRIRLTDERNRPFRRASVWVRGSRDGEVLFTSAGSAGEDGIYLLARVATGTELQISPSAMGRAEKLTTVEINGEPRLHDIEVEMPREGPQGVLELRVLDDGGDPMRKAVVRLTNEAGSGVRGFYGKRVELDADGRCRLDVPGGRFELTVSDSDAFVSAEGYALPSAQKIAVTPGESLPVEAVLLTGGRVRVTVTDSASEVVAALRLDLLDDQGKRVLLRFIRVIEGGWTTSLDKPGPALLGKPVPSGRYRVRCEHKDKLVAEREVDIPRGKTAEVTIQLPRR